LSDTHPRYEVAVVATPDGGFTFQIFMVSGEPRTLQTGTQRFVTPADAAQAGYAVIAAKCPLTRLDGDVRATSA
jgi:hypothetical protein